MTDKSRQLDKEPAEGARDTIERELARDAQTKDGSKKESKRPPENGGNES